MWVVPKRSRLLGYSVVSGSNPASQRTNLGYIRSIARWMTRVISSICLLCTNQDGKPAEGSLAVRETCPSPKTIVYSAPFASIRGGSLRS